MKREKFGSRLGFILISAGCAIGLGNVWRFPYITGQYGGAAFVLIYLFFLLTLGLPIMVMEFSVGRASQASIALSFDKLEPEGTRWHWYKYFGMAGNYLLMMFYTTIGGWMLIYFIKTLKGDFEGQSVEQVGVIFEGITANPWLMIGAMVLVVALCLGVCSFGLQNGVEKVTKVMMVSLFAIMVVLAVHSVTMENAGTGLEFYLYPRFDKLWENGLADAVFAAMGQAFFTLSIGMGSLAIFGSYIGKEHSLLGESARIVVLDTFVAITAGLIIFPACFTYGVDQTSGPSLIFITLPNIFANMSMGRLWGSLFFLFMAFAAMSTVLAVFENIICCGMELTGCSRKKSSLVNLVLIILLSMPCVLGYNLWAWDGFAVFGGAVLDLEDFLVSNLFLPLGSLVYLLFCVSKWGWGFDKYVAEANKGEGLKFAKWLKPYFQFVLPALIVVIFLQGLL